MTRCAVAIQFGTILATRCSKPEDHGVDAGEVSDVMHEGKGLAQFFYQRVQWMPGDRRAFITDRDDEFAWERPA